MFVLSADYSNKISEYLLLAFEGTHSLVVAI